MKRSINIIVFSLFTFAFNKAKAQQVTPTAYNSSIKVNYVRIWTPVKPYTSDADVTSSSRNIQEVQQTTDYFDGLGRPLQTVVKQGSYYVWSTPSRDMVTPHLYDSFGREAIQYQTFPSTSRDGYFKLDPFQQDSAFHKGKFSDESYIYNKTKFESSPLSRVIEIYGPGNSWVGTASETSEADRRGIKTKHLFNKAVDSVKIWNVSNVSNGFGTYSTSAMYPAGELTKTLTLDEHNNQVAEFKDKEGKVILKKVPLLSYVADDGNGKGHYGWLCTYYIYDDLGLLRCVVQPKGVELLATNSWDMSYSSNVIVNEQCFRYEYNKRGLMTMKKVPGAGVIYMVYDSRDRLALSQDSSLRALHQWLYTQYDDLNRPVATGIITDNSYYNNATYHRGQAESTINYPSPGSYSVDTLTKTFYDDYTWRGGQGNPLSDSRITTYDGYMDTESNTVYPYARDAVTQTKLVRGLVTGTKTKILNSNDNIYSVNFYDHKGRAIQSQSTNITGGTNVSSTQYTFFNQAYININKHQKNGSNSQTHIVITINEFDSIGRVWSIMKRLSCTVGGQTVERSQHVTSRMIYNELGQLFVRGFDQGYNEWAGLSTQLYTYNIRGWLTSINRSFVAGTGEARDYFGMELAYDKATSCVGTNAYTNQEHNGNIGGIIWKSGADGEVRKYDYTYDAVNRLKSADFNQYTSGTFSKSAGIDLSVSDLSYDANGNILSMKQRGWKLGGSETIDSLRYTYISNSNRLLNVLDYKNDTATKLGDFRSSKAYVTALVNPKDTTATDYGFDGNGNLSSDLNKDISFIRYNYLNLPDSIAVTGKGNIKYVYDAAGIKLKKITTEGSTITTTLYLFGNYVNDTLQFLPFEDGRIRLKNGQFYYDYFHKDHLGNVRMVITEQRDTNSYIPASLETTPLPTEKLIYARLDTGRVNKNTVSGYPTDNYTSPNDFIQKLSGNGAKIGSSIVLKVMTGDKFNIMVSSWWNSGGSPGSPVSPLNDLIAGLAGGVDDLGGLHESGTSLINSGVLSPNLTSFLSSQSGYNSSRPKAFLNWVLFDERFNFVSSSSGFEQVDAANSFKVHTQTGLTVGKGGYLYIYVSNESPDIDVFFDNLQVTHFRSPVTEDTHYYPFGLAVTGISSQSLEFGDPKNKEKTFQSQRFDDDLGINWVQFKWRNHDPQIGRFTVVDPLSEKYEYNSTYAFSENKVTNHVELEGLEAVDAKSANVLTDLRYSQDADKKFRIKHTYQNVTRTISFNPNGEGKIGYFFSNTPNVSMLDALAMEGDSPNHDFSMEVAKRDKIEGNYADLSVNGAGNTFRHLLLGSVLTGAFGEHMTKRITDMYERGDGNDKQLSLDQQVDLMNTSYGITYALENNVIVAELVKSNENAANFLNNLAVHTLSKIPEYANNPDYQNLINGEKKMFSAESNTVKFFIHTLNRLINENQKHVTEPNKKE